jgi:hypothetical protein
MCPPAGGRGVLDVGANREGKPSNQDERNTMTGHVTAVRALLEVAPPGWDVTSGFLETTSDRTTLHLHRCQGAHQGTYSLSKPLSKLLAPFNADSNVSLCQACSTRRTHTGHNIADLETLRNAVNVYEHEYRARVQATRPVPATEHELHSFTSEMIWLSHSLFLDNVKSYLALSRIDQAKNDPRVLDLIVGTWRRARSEFELALGRGIATANIKAPVKQSFVVLPKGPFFSSTWAVDTGSTLDLKLRQVAALEQPRWAETSSSFITTATCSRRVKFSSPMKRFPAPRGAKREHFQTALELSERDNSGQDIHDLIVAVSNAHD